jgi:hypothetical protein
MYVIPIGHRIFGFGLTHEAARKHLVSSEICYDGPWLETYPCSPELYRRLEAEGGRVPSAIPCRIDSNGVAVADDAESRRGAR